MEKYQDKSVLEELYLKQGLLQKEIAKKFNVSRRTIGNWLRKHNIPTRTGYENLRANKKTNKQFLLEVSKQENNEEYKFLEKYKDYHTPIRCEHKVCGYIWKVQPGHFISRGTRCPKCANERNKKKLRKTQIEFEKEVAKKSPEYIVLSKYKNYHSSVLAQHKKCKTKFKIIAQSLLTGYHQCPYCNKRYSGHEIKMAKILDKYDYDYVTQYTFDNCRDTNVLPFDFAVLKNGNIDFLLEVDGRQHFEPVSAFGGKEKFKDTKKKDKIREVFCKDNNIKLIRIDARDWSIYKIVS